MPACLRVGNARDANRRHRANGRQLLAAQQAGGIPMSGEKPTTVRLPPDLTEDLAYVARIDGTTIAAAIRIAVFDHIEKRRSDPEFQARLRERVDADAVLLARLSEGPGAGR